MNRSPLARYAGVCCLSIVGWLALAGAAISQEKRGDLFRDEVTPILQKRCVGCHQGARPRGGLDLSRAAGVIEGRGEGSVIVPGKPDDSYLLEVVTGDEPSMPKNGDPLTAAEVAVLRKWIAAGAPWPRDLVLKQDRTDWWSLKPLRRPALPKPGESETEWVRTPIDAFIRATHFEQRLTPAPEADRRTLIRRLSFDLIGLPPTPDEVDAFVNDPDPHAYEKLVDRLLASPHYGERWARHWLDVAHYADTHGFDKDKLRPNAWPYRDYVIRAFNEDKPYALFVREQLAGDVYHPQTRDGIVALGFIAAGPFDWVGQIEVANGSVEKKRVRNLDRDDMVSTTMNTFVSLTAQCARCHDHKFDPITQEDYYSLQAVFAAVDRADRPYESDPGTAAKRGELLAEVDRLEKQQTAVNAEVHKAAGPELAALEKRIAELSHPQGKGPKKRPEYGYHSRIEPRADTSKWVQVDLGRPTPISRIIVVGCHDDYAGIGAGFGFPRRYRIEIANDPDFEDGVVRVVDRTGEDVKNPGIAPQSFAADGTEARYVRVTATRLAERRNDYIFALAELSVLTADGTNAALNAEVTSLDSIEAPPRWRRTNLVDGYYYGIDKQDPEELARLTEQRQAVLDQRVAPDLVKRQAEITAQLTKTRSRLESLPNPGLVFAAAQQFERRGNFVSTGGTPRTIHVLDRGSVNNPGKEVGPGTVSCIDGLPARFELPAEAATSQRRAALAEWIVDERNPLTWRSIVNRIWHYHFGRGLVDSPNDFGHMGSRPTHPELLDWLAVEFRDGGGSIKDLHRLICCSATYRQQSAHHAGHARIDAGNRYLWRMNRRRLEAEAVRDAVLAVSGKLDRRMGGPGFKPFGFRDDHSPHYHYDRHDPDDPASHRRSVYRFIVRSVPDPFMTSLDCADPSINVARRNETLTAVQALALLNNRFMVRMAEHFARRVEATSDELPAQITAAYRLALGRGPTRLEAQTLTALARQHGLENACRLILNTNEFIFVD